MPRGRAESKYGRSTKVSKAQESSNEVDQIVKCVESGLP